jgi:hypothetical protein
LAQQRRADLGTQRPSSESLAQRSNGFAALAIEASKKGGRVDVTERW